MGQYRDLKKRSETGDLLDVHHAPQEHPALQKIEGYNPKTAPSIVLPKKEHLRIPNVKGEYKGSARDLLAQDVRN